MSFFGRKESPSSSTAEALPPAASTAGGKAALGTDPGRKRKLWAALLVLDVVFLFIFGTAIAGLLYMRSSVPALADVPARTKGSKPGSTAKAPSPPVAEPRGGSVEAPKAEETKKAEEKPQDKKEPPQATAPHSPKAEKPSVKGPTGSPGVHAAALPKHAASEPIATAAKAEKPAAPAPPPRGPAPGGKVRARPVEFSFSSPSAKEVLLRGPFLVRSGGKAPMVKDSEGVWRLSISLLPGSYKYSFIVDGRRLPNVTRVVE